MKKLFACLLFCALVLPLQSRADDLPDYLLEDEALWNDIEAYRASTRPNADSSGAEQWWKKDRTYEVGLANLEFGFPSSLLKETFVIKLGELSNGYFAGLSLVPIYFKYANDDWGYRIFTGADAEGYAALSEKLADFKKVEKAKKDKSSYFAAAVFAEAGADGFYRLGKFKLKAGFAGFIPLYYAIPNEIAYSLEDSMALDYEIRLFSVIKNKKFKLNKELGFDLRLGAEYPLASFIDLGLDVVNIPLVPAQFTQYQQIKGHIYLGGSGASGGGFEDLFDVETGTERTLPCKKFVLRPLKTLFWADWRPLDTPLFSVIGSAGFQLNWLYSDIFSFEGGLKARFDWENIIIVTGGVRYEDRLWKNGVEIALNCRAFELDLGIDMRSLDFADSWKGSFIGLSFGIKAGW